MGLDNGIYITKAGNDEKIKLSERYSFWGDEIAYWRKCWGIRRVILEILEESKEEYDDYCISRPQLKEIINALKLFNKKAYWDKHADSIWTFEEFKHNRKKILRNLKWLYRYMYFHPEIKVYFYDSY